MLRPQKILLLTTELDFGGVEVGILKRAVALRDMGADVQLACLNKLGKIGTELQDLGFDVHSLDSSPKIQSIGTAFRLARLQTRLKPDIVHAACIEANFHSVIASKLTGQSKVIAEEVGVLIDGRGMYVRGWKARQAGRFVWKSSDLALAVAECVKQTMVDTEGAAPGKVAVIPYSIDTSYLGARADRPSGNGGRELIVGCVARLSPEKGQAMLIRAFQAAAVQRPELRLWLVGDGPSRSELEQLARDLGISHLVHFWGVRRDIPELLKKMDLFVLASQWEGLPNAILEAMAAGVPVIATSVGGVPEVIRHQETGWLVPVDDVSALRSEMVSFCETSRDRRDEVAQAAQSLVMSEYSPETVTKRLLQIYAQVLGCETDPSRVA